MSEPAGKGRSDARVTVPDLVQRKAVGPRIVAVTAYDATFARMVDDAGVDVLLVGDSLAMVVQGKSTTLEVTVEDMVYHARAVSRGAKRAHVVVDMPFLAAEYGADRALEAAGRLISEGRGHAVKIEGGKRLAGVVRRLVEAGIPVMGHVGLMPQHVHAIGGFRVQGRDAEQAAAIVEDARALEDAGVYAIVIESVPPDVTARVTASVGVPTIGIGAGPSCDGQVLVCYDLLGCLAGFTPRFVKQFEHFYERGVAAVREFSSDVRNGTFPALEHTYAPLGKRGETT